MRSPSRSPVPRFAGTSGPPAPTAISSGATTRSSGRCAATSTAGRTTASTLEDLAEVGPGKVVGICRERGKPKDGPAVDRRFGGLWLVEDGQDLSWATYLTPREAVRAAKELLGGHIEVDQIKRTSPPAEVKRIEPASAPAPAPAPAAPEPESVEAAEPIEAPERQAPAPQADRPRKKALTKSEEQKRAARARARLRTQSSRQTA